MPTPTHILAVDAEGNVGKTPFSGFGGSGFNNIDGGSANSIELATQNIDGGSATSIETEAIDGGNAFN